MPFNNIINYKIKIASMNEHERIAFRKMNSLYIVTMTMKDHLKTF